MNCEEFKREMNNFINNCIDDDKVEDFILHYKQCKECNEELEIYYMINKTFTSSDNNGNTVSLPDSYDFKGRLNNKIRKYEEYITNKNKANVLSNFVYLGTEMISLVMAVYFIFLILGGNNVW